MEKKNRVFIATSIDGYIADKNGELDWLNSFPNPDKNDMGYGAFTAQIDALVMGRITFEMVCSFDIDWPYQKPVFVLSNTMTEIPEKLKDNAQLVKGTLKEILKKIHEKGYYRLYIDGGATIQGFLKEDLIHDMIITTIPILLGDGVPLFSKLPNNLEFECIHSKIFIDKIAQNQYKRKNKVTNVNNQ
jgi:dihydrofolate reductase